MTAAALVMELRRGGVGLEAHGDQLVVDGPAHLLTDALLGDLRRLKSELLCLVSGTPIAQPGNGTVNSEPSNDTGAVRWAPPTPREHEIIAWLQAHPVPSVAPAEFPPVHGPLALGDVPVGWTPAAWAAELRRKAHRCQELHPDTADYYTRWADNIEQRLGRLARPARSALGGGYADKKQR